MKTIPVAHCFDNNYVIPAAVAFTSMLRYASKDFFYKFYVMHTDITEENQERLRAEVEKFPNSTLEFISMDNKFDDLFEATNSKGHYSKEMFYKFLLPEVFPQYDKIIVTDVDVLYRGDISVEFENFDVNDDFFLAGCTGPKIKDSWLEKYSHSYDNDFTEEERKSLMVGAGYLIYNLKKMRENDMIKKFIEFAYKNSSRILQPEQDVINLVCAPKIKILPYGNMICTYLHDILKTDEDFERCYKIPGEQVKQGLLNPVQVHYATSTKPWNTPDCTKSDLWYGDLLRTQFFYDCMRNFSVKKKESAELKKVVGGGIKHIIKMLIPPLLWELLRKVKAKAMR